MKLFKKQHNADNVRQPHISSQNDDYAFRRSRTLTGSASSNVAAAGEGRAQIKSSRLKEYQLRAHRRQLAVYLLLTLGLVWLIGWMVGQFVWGFDETVSRRQLASGQSLPADQYQKIVEDYYAQNPLERFRFVLRPEALKDYAMERRPEIADLSVNDGSSLLGGRLEVEVRQPILVWRLGDTTYYVDGQGRPFTDNYYPAPRLTVDDNSGLSPASGALASNRILHFIGRTVALVNQSPVGDVEEIIIPAGYTRRIDMKLQSTPYALRTQLDRDPAGQAADIVASVKYMKRHGLTPKYVDVRVSSKAFYR